MYACLFGHFTNGEFFHVFFDPLDLKYTLNITLVFRRAQGAHVLARHLERRLPVSGLERDPACHPERSEGSSSIDTEILRCAQDDRHDLQMSTFCRESKKKMG